MSPLTVTLTMANGPLVGQEYEFRDSAVYIMGRARSATRSCPTSSLTRTSRGTTAS